MRISACVITKNEEENIGTCLESMQSIVDEIILVDTGSIDNTIDIAKSYGAKIFPYKWNQDFAAAKNYAIEKANGEWIIFLDADEYFPVESINDVKTYIENMNSNKKCHAICVKINNIDKDRNNILLSSFTTARIFRNLPNLRYKESIHEELYNTQGKINFFIREKEIEVYHTGYSTNIVNKKLQRNLAIILREMEKEGEQTKYYRYLCDCYHGLGEYKKAVYYGKLHIASGGTSLGSESIVYTKIIESLIHSDASTDEVKAEIQLAIEQFPTIPDFYDRYARYVCGQYEYDLALEYFLKSLEIYKNKKKNSYEADSFEGRISSSYFIIGEIYFLQNKNQEAISYYVEALLGDKYNIAAFRQLYYLTLTIDPIEIIAVLNKLYTRTKKDIKFIVDNLSGYIKNKVFVYYSTILEKEFSGEIAQKWQYQMISIKDYDKFYEKSVQCIKSKFQIIASMLIAENKKNFDKENITYLPSAYLKIVERFYKNETLLEDDDVAIYEMILYELMLIKTNTFPLYVQIATDFSIDKIFHIANMLESYNKYVDAIALYEQIKTISAEQELTSDERLGFCYYELQDYEKAKMFFAKIIAAGKGNNKVVQFNKWCQEKTKFLI